MALRGSDYASYSKRSLANRETETSIPGSNNELNFIVIPHWIADKIELMGGNPGQLLHRRSGRDTTRVSPEALRIREVVVGEMVARGGLSGLQKRVDCPGDKVNELNANDSSDSAEKVTRESLMLSAEDWGDIALLGYLLGAAFNMVKLDIGLTTSNGNFSRNYTRSYALTDKTNKLVYSSWDFGNIGVMYVPPKSKDLLAPGKLFGGISNFSNEFLEGYITVSGCSTFHNRQHVHINDILNHAITRFMDCVENIPERIVRDGGAVNVYDNQSTITFVLKPDTISAVIRAITAFKIDNDHKALRDILVRIMEVIIESNKKWFSIRKLSRSGLILHLSRLL